MKDETITMGKTVERKNTKKLCFPFQITQLDKTSKILYFCPNLANLSLELSVTEIAKFV